MTFLNSRHRSALGALTITLIAWVALVSGCASAPASGPAMRVQLPLLAGWFQGEVVFYVTTDVSDAAVAKAKGANFAPRLAVALAAAPTRPGRGLALDKVYAVTNFEQGSVFASAPRPLGHGNRDTGYSPLWQMVTVTWQPNRPPTALKSEEEVLAAAERGWVLIEATPVVLNCPIVHAGPSGGLPGVELVNPGR